MRATIIPLLAALGLSGCISMDDITPDTTPKDRSYYRIDTELRHFCLGDTDKCADMSKVVSAMHMLKPIEAAYNTTIKGPNYPVSLMRTVMYPSDEKYTAKPLGTNGRHFSVPITPRTQQAWRVILEIEKDHYFN